MTEYRKAVAQILTGLLAWGGAVTVSSYKPIAASEWMVLAGVIVGGFLVWWLPNDARLNLGDEGQSWVGPLLIFLIGFILGALCYANGILVGK